jgi:hypothetical protein
MFCDVSLHYNLESLFDFPSNIFPFPVDVTIIVYSETNKGKVQETVTWKVHLYHLWTGTETTKGRIPASMHPQIISVTRTGCGLDEGRATVSALDPVHLYISNSLPPYFLPSS